LNENINIVNKNTRALSEASREVGIELNTQKTMCVFISHHQNARQHHNLLRAWKSSKNVDNFKYL